MKKVVYLVLIIIMIPFMVNAKEITSECKITIDSMQNKKIKGNNYNTYIKEIVIDEAQDFDVRALEILARHIRYICISADFDQQMYSGRIQNENTLLNLLGYFGKQINLHHLIFWYSKFLF